MLYNYRGTNWEIVVSLIEKISSGNSNLFSSSSFLFVKKAGTFEIVRAAILLFSIKETSNMVAYQLHFSERTNEKNAARKMLASSLFQKRKKDISVLDYI